MMKRFTFLAAIAAAALWCGTASAGEPIKLPTGPYGAKAQVTTAVDHGDGQITDVRYGRRIRRNRAYRYGAYRPYYGYGYGSPYYGGSYSRPYYGYSGFGPGLYGGLGGYGGWGGYNGLGFGAGPMAFGRMGGMYW